MITGKIIEKLPKSLREKIESNYELRNIIGNINWLTLESVFKGIVNLVVFALVARYLGPADLGIMTYAYAFVSLFSGFSTLGLDSISIREIVGDDKGKKNEYLGTIFALKIVGSILMVVFSLVFIIFVKPHDSQTFLFVLIIVLGYLVKPFDTIDYWFQSQVQAKYPVIARMVAFIITTVLKLIFVKIKAPLIYFIYLYTVEFIITALILIYFYSRVTKNSLLKWKYDSNIAKSLILDSWPLFLGTIMAMIYMKMDQVMIGNMLGTEDVSFYYTAVKLSEAWYFFPTVIGASVFPAILSAKKEGEKKYKERLQSLFDLSTWAGIAIAVLIGLSSKFLIKMFYGDEYAISANVLSVHIWSGVFVFSGIVASKWVVTENLTKNALLRSVIGAGLSVVLYYILISHIGIVGAAIATVLSYAFVNYFSLFFWKKTRECFIMQTKAFNILRVFKPGKIFKFLFKRISFSLNLLNLKLRNKFSKNIGISPDGGNNKTIVSLTSYPKRFEIVYLTLESLLKQTVRPYKIILWLAKEEADENILPKNLLKMKRRGVEIRYKEGNLKSYKKLIYALKEFPDSCIITVDDDTIYPSWFVERIVKEYKRNSEDIIAYRCSYMEKCEKGLLPYQQWKSPNTDRASFNLFPTGAGGILYPPHSLNESVFNEELFMKLCPKADDIWFKAMGLLNNRKVKLVEGKNMDFPFIKKVQKDSLWRINVEENQNDVQLKNVFDYFDLYKYID